jgi:hypothetical protein
MNIEDVVEVLVGADAGESPDADFLVHNVLLYLQLRRVESMAQRGLSCAFFLSRCRRRRSLHRDGIRLKRSSTGKATKSMWTTT